MSGLGLFDEPKKKRVYVNKEDVKAIHGKKCKVCGATEKEVGKLEMAHLKAHSKGGNLVVPMCPNCHSRYDNGLMKAPELKKLGLTAEKYKAYRPKKRKAKPKNAFW
jgi:heterodisulfide reductase subunit B